MADIERAAKAASCHEFIQELEEGYQSMIGGARDERSGRASGMDQFGRWIREKGGGVFRRKGGLSNPFFLFFFFSRAKDWWPFSPNSLL